MGDVLLHNTGEIVNGRYEIVQNIGHGAMGEVFVAKDISKNSQKIAIKYLKGLPGRSKALEHFKSEFATLTHLSHPHIAKVYDFEQDAANSQFFFTSELVNGRDLINATALSTPTQIEELFVQALRALEYLHGNGIFHFDIKAANLLVTEAPAVKLIDFGLAAIRFQGALAGTPSYMAPEMVRKDDPDSRADLYSLGVLIYAALTKINPFRSTNMEATLENQLKLHPRPPSMLNPDIPKYLDHVIMRLLEKRPADRYQTAGQAIKDLNLRSATIYSVETEETKESYIPWESKFIGRRKELKEVTQLLADKRPALITVKGGSGTGKSRFLNEVKHLAQISEWVTHFLTDPFKIPEWQRTVGTANGKPVLLGIDDLEAFTSELWGQGITETLERAARGSTKEAPVIIAITLSDENKDGPSFGKLKKVDVALDNFDKDEVREYLVTMTGLEDPPKSIVEQIFSNTGGNPFILTELLRTIVTSGLLVDAQGRWKESTFDDIKIDLTNLSIPAGVEERLLGEFLHLPKDARALSELMSVLNRAIRPDEVEKFSTLGSPRGLLTLLMRRGLVKYDLNNGTYNFSKPLSSRAIYNSLSAADRCRWHAIIASVIASEAKQSPEHLYHLGRAGNTDEARSAMARLVEIQTTAHNNHEAIYNAIYYLSKWKDPKMTVELAQLYNRISKFDLAIRTIEELQDAGLDAELKNRALETTGVAYLRKMDYAGAMKYFTKALDDSKGLSKPLRLRLDNFIAEVRFFEGKLDDAIAIYKRTAEEEARLLPEERLQIFNNGLGQAYFQKGDYKNAIAQLEKDLAVFSGTDNKRFVARTRFILAEAYRVEHDHERSAENFNELIRYAKETNDLEHLFRGYNGLGNLYNDDSKFAEAEKYYERALDVATRLGHDEQGILCIANIGIINSNTGNVAKAKENYATALAYLDGKKTKGGIMEQYHCRLHMEMGDILRIGRQFEEAKEHLSEAWDLALSPTNEVFRFWVKLTQLKLAKDSRDEGSAMQLLAEAKTLADTEDKLSKIRTFENS